MLALEVQVAVAKVRKYATSESGDTLEMVERPHGGISLVLVDGQRSGHSAKAISQLVARKAVALLGEGVRDGAAARAAHDYLRASRWGKVSATLNIVSVDMETQSLVISRNNPCPVAIVRRGKVFLWDEPSEAVGIRPWTRPVIHELPLEAGIAVIAFTDGLLHAGERYGCPMDLRSFLEVLISKGEWTARELADRLLADAVSRDQGRPTDDVSVLVVAVLPREEESLVRRMDVLIPLNLLGRI